MVLRETLALAAVATAAGVAGAVACTRLLSSYLYGVTPTDPATFAVAAALVVTASLAAACLPACRAATTDPVVALRGDG
jgi:putative ABC transport system permease protein